MSEERIEITMPELQQWYNEVEAELAEQPLVRISRGDVAAIERAADASMRAREYQTALDAYSVALRLRSETGFHPLRRADDEPSTQT